MERLRFRVYVTLKPGVHDPAGLAVQNGLHSMGYDEVGAVRLGRYIEMEVERRPDAIERIQEMCRKLLSNPVIENYRIEPVER